MYSTHAIETKRPMLNARNAYCLTNHLHTSSCTGGKHTRLNIDHCDCTAAVICKRPHVLYSTLPLHTQLHLLARQLPVSVQPAHTSHD